MSAEVPEANDTKTLEKFLNDFEELGASTAPTLEEIVNRHSVIDDKMLQSVLSKSGIKKNPKSHAEVYFVAWFLYLQDYSDDEILKKIPILKLETLLKWQEDNKWKDRKDLEMKSLHMQAEKEMIKHREEAVESVSEKVSLFVQRLEKKIYENIDKIEVKDALRQFLPAMKLKATLSGELDDAKDDEDQERLALYRKLNETINESDTSFKPTKPIFEARIVTPNDSNDRKKTPSKSLPNKENYTL